MHEGTTKLVGMLANGALRKLCNTAHHYFNKLDESGEMTKDEAYPWLVYMIFASKS